jgi:hypothetical protein
MDIVFFLYKVLDFDDAVLLGEPFFRLHGEIGPQVLLKVVRHSAVQETQGLLQGLDPEVVQQIAEGDEFSVLA